MNITKKILILSANPKDTSRLRLDEEVREIEEGLRRSKYRDQFIIQSKWAVRLRDLRRAMLDEEPQIVHFCGHGEEDGLMVEDDHGNAILVNPDALAGLFELFRNKVQCVLLNACYSEPQANAINRHINYVIGMNQGITDKAALEFAVGFYDALGAGKSVEEAFKFGRNAIQLYNIPEYLTPILERKSNSLLKKEFDQVQPTNNEHDVSLSKKEDETNRDIQLLKDSLQGRIDELIGYLEEKAKTVVKDLSPYYKYANVESYLDNFQKLHARHIDCLNKGQLILAHEIMIKIHEISYELESDEISPGYQIKIPGTRYNLGWSNKFQRGRMICTYIVGDMSKDSPAYPKKIGIIAGTKGKLEDLSKVYQIILARIDKNNK